MQERQSSHRETGLIDDKLFVRICALATQNDTDGLDKLLLSEEMINVVHSSYPSTSSIPLTPVMFLAKKANKQAVELLIKKYKARISDAIQGAALAKNEAYQNELLEMQAQPGDSSAARTDIKKKSSTYSDMRFYQIPKVSGTRCLALDAEYILKTASDHYAKLTEYKADNFSSRIQKVKEGIKQDGNTDIESLNEVHYYLYHLRQFVIAVDLLIADKKYKRYKTIKEMRNYLAHYAYGLNESDVIQAIDTFNFSVELTFKVSQQDVEKELLFANIVANMDLSELLKTLHKIAYRETIESEPITLPRLASLCLSFVELLIINQENYGRLANYDLAKNKLYDSMQMQLIEIGLHCNRLLKELKFIPLDETLKQRINECAEKNILLRNLSMHDLQGITSELTSDALDNANNLKDLLTEVQQSLDKNNRQDHKCEPYRFGYGLSL